MNRTKIEWVKNPDGTQGYTWNPITGCLNHDNGTCRGGGFPCYAYKLANGRLRERYLYNTNLAPFQFEDGNLSLIRMDVEAIRHEPFYPRFWEDRLNELRTDRGLMVPWSKDRGIFVCDMGDLFGIGIPEEWTWEVMQKIEAYSWHRFYLLTKQPQNLIKWSPFPDNCWVGVTVTRCTTSPKSDYLSNALNGLAAIEAKVKYLSLEPLLEWQFEAGCHDLGDLLVDVVDWLIIGACTGKYTEMAHLSWKTRQEQDFEHIKQVGNKWTLQPKIEHVREIVEAADKARIPVFLKDNLQPILKQRGLSTIPYRLLTKNVKGRYELRQEMPE